MLTKFEILKEKIKRIVQTEDIAKKEFLTIIACHNGRIPSDSLPTSFDEFKKKYGEEKFEEVKNYLIEEGIIFITDFIHQPIQFSVKNEKGEYDSKGGGELSRFLGKLIFEQEAEIKETIEELISEVEGRELLRYMAIERGIHLIDGVDPEIKERIGKQSYEKNLARILKLGILNPYAWSSRKHGYTGYKLLPYIDEYIKSRLGIFELEDIEKTVLTYIFSIDKIFSRPRVLHVGFNYPNEYDRETLRKCTLAKKFLASMTYRSLEEIENIIENLKKKGLVSQVDLGYTRSGYHRGIVLQLTESGKEIISQEENKLMGKVKDRIESVFSDKDTKIVYFLFTKRKVPVKILSLVKKNSVDTLIEACLISQKDELFLEFDEKSSLFETIYEDIDHDEAEKWLKEKCRIMLTDKEKLLLGFLSTSKIIVLGKYVDRKSWYSVTPRTQRNYQRAYENLVINFPYLKKLFSLLTNLSMEELDKTVSKLDENGFLLQERDTACGYPGHAIIYRIPVKFDFKFDTSTIETKVKEYIQFLAKNLNKSYNQLIFLNYLIQVYERYQYEFMVPKSLVDESLLNLLKYAPPAEYSPIYAIEKEMILLHRLVKERLKREIYEIRTELTKRFKNVLHEATRHYQNNIAYNCSEPKVEGFFILNIESPDPLVGIVSFIVTPWITPLDVEEIRSLCIKSNTANLFVSYPNYPQVASMISVDGKYNLSILRNNNIYSFLKKVDKVTQDIFTRLSQFFKHIKEVEKPKREIEELIQKYPNLSKVRFIIPEIEEKLREAIRPSLKKEFGDNWEDKIRERFPKAVARKQKWEQEHPGERSDILQGLSIGDFKALFEDKTFSFLKDSFKNFTLVKASLQVFLSKKVYHHGRPKNGKDISNDEVDAVDTAYKILLKMVKR
jgi:DNA-binding MarR family transcriptional regulator